MDDGVPYVCTFNLATQFVLVIANCNRSHDPLLDGKQISFDPMGIIRCAKIIQRARFAGCTTINKYMYVRLSTKVWSVPSI